MSRRVIVVRKPSNDVGQPSSNRPPNKIIARKPCTLQLCDFSSDYNIASHVDPVLISNCLIDRNVARLLKDVYCSTKAPHRNCVRFTGGQLQVYTNSSWSCPKTQQQLLRELIETAYRIMRAHFNNHPDSVIDAHHQRKLEPNMYKIECWLEDLWDNALDNIDDIHRSILVALSTPKK